MEEIMSIPLWASVPFGLMLLCIAIGPLLFEHWWEKNLNKLLVALALGIPTAVYLMMNNMTAALEHQLLYDYIPFIVLLTSLFVISGGIHLSGDIQAKPWVNTLFLAIGFVLASFLGTTGAAMLLIRPLITTNSQRKYKTHTILFFIAAVANCGGMLTPLGDPPLFLLYLRGASFTWFLHLLPEWAFVGALLLLIYFLTDKYYYNKEPKENIKADDTQTIPLKLGGRVNFLLLLGVIASVAFINSKYIPAIDAEHAPIAIKFLREYVLVALIILSLVITKQKVHQLNKFTWTPIIEVGVLFLGIFITMVPALMYLKGHAADFGITKPWQFVYASGALSSFLDNAPTAVAFHGVASGLVEAGQTGLVAGIAEEFLKAIAVGSVFFGAMTYIGNGPNFMIKAIAEESGIKMPSFFGYMFKFSLIVLLPIYIVMQLLFL